MSMNCLSSIMIVGCKNRNVNNILEGAEGGIVYHFSSGEEAINEISVIKPDVIFMDVILEGMTGFEAAKWIKEQNHKVKIIMVSKHLNREFMNAGIEVGADGYLDWGACQRIFNRAIRSVLDGNSWFAYALSYFSWLESYLLPN